MKVESSAIIHRPQNQVFGFIGSYENDPLWSGAIVASEKITAGPVEVGTILRRVARLAGKEFLAKAEIFEFEAGSRSCWKTLSSPVSQIESRYCEPVTEGTKFTLILESENTNYFNLAEEVLKRIMQRQLEADLKNLKDLLEATN